MHREHGRFMARQRHVARGERAARRQGTVACVKSSPALRIWRPMRGASRTVILGPSALVSSWITIESAPMGKGPPVKMRTVSPG